MTRSGAVDAGATALVAAGGVLATRAVLLGEIVPAFAAALAGVALVVLWRRARPRPLPAAVEVGLGAAYTAWAAAFVALASTTGPDGRRYFGLFDDALVSMRYAWNLAHGAGLVWNPGERVEGYTNLLMTLAMAVPAALLDRSRAVLAVQFAGVATMLGTAALASRLARRLGAPSGVGAFAAVVACYPLAYWTLLGMETGLLALLVAAASALALAPGEPGRPRRLVGVLAGLALATRPDGLLAAAVLLGFRAIRHRRAPGGGRAWLAEVAAFAAFPLGLALFRWLYYGALVPNTYVLKVVGLPLSYRLSVGVVTVLPYLVWMAPALGLAAVALRQPVADRRLLAALAASSLAFHVWVGGDAWPRWRFLSPTAPLVLVLAALGARELAGAWRRPRLAAAALAVAVASMNGPFLREAALQRYAFGVPDVQLGVRVALELTRVLRPEATVGVFFAGAVPYYTGLRAVDFLGKCDPRVARRPPDLGLGIGHNKSDLAYSIGERRPDFVEGFSWGRDDALALREGYVRSGELWLRRGSPHVRWELVGAAADADVARPPRDPPTSR